MHREYETVVILHPETLEDGVHRFTHKVKELFDSKGGILLRVENWGKRKLAYEINKETKGIYVYYQYLGSMGLVEEFERTMRISDTSMRYQTVKLADDVDAEARAVDESAQIDFLEAAAEAERNAAEALLRQESEAEAAAAEAAARAAAAAAAEAADSDAIPDSYAGYSAETSASVEASASAEASASVEASAKAEASVPTDDKPAESEDKKTPQTQSDSQA